MSAEVLVGVDVGTTSAKAGVVDTDGRELAHGYRRMPWEAVPTGAQMDPEALFATALGAVEDAVAQVPDGRVVAIGVTGMAETGVLVDSAGVPLAPAIAWYDGRGAAEAEELAAALGSGMFAATTGLALLPLCTIAKYRWLRRHVEGAAAGRRWFNVAEWVVHRLGGSPLAELSLASRTGWLDVGVQGWWPDALAAAGAPPGLLPELVGAGTAAGKADGHVPRLQGAVLTVGGHDHHCGAVGVGATRDGDVYDSCGTAEAFIAPARPPVAPDRVRALVERGVNVGWHTVPGRLALLGAQREGLALQRVLDLLGVGRRDRPALDADALRVDPGALRFEGLEDDELTIRGVGWDASPARLWRAALEAVTATSAAILTEFEAVAGGTQRLVVSGGWARSEAYREVKRAALGDFAHPDVVEPGVRGAALLAGLAAGTFGSVDEFPPPKDAAP